MTEVEFLKKLSGFRTQKQKFINNTYLWTALAIKSLKIIADDNNYVSELLRFNVPSKKLKGKIINRKKEDIKCILNDAADKELYNALFTYVVAQFESFLTDIISLVLTYDKRKLRINCQGSDNNKKMDFSEVLDCTSYNDIINVIIEKQLCSLFYASPKKQIEYIQKVINFEIDEEKWNKWVECKATRDIIVHNAGIINKIYIEKTGSNARGIIGEEIVVDKLYFENLLVLSKSLIGIMVNQAKKISL